jgi:hypothetical protein
MAAAASAAAADDDDDESLLGAVVSVFVFDLTIFAPVNPSSISAANAWTSSPPSPLPPPLPLPLPLLLPLPLPLRPPLWPPLPCPPPPPSPCVPSSVPVPPDAPDAAPDAPDATDGECFPRPPSSASVVAGMSIAPGVGLSLSGIRLVTWNHACCRQLNRVLIANHLVKSAKPTPASATARCAASACTATMR